jgi:hypothetical protein
MPQAGAESSGATVAAAAEVQNVHNPHESPGGLLLSGVQGSPY